MAADPRVVRAIRQIARKRRVSPKELLAAFETGIVESGLRNLGHGDADSQGWRQERRSLYPDPMNLTASINRFFDETGRVKDKYATAGQLAAAVQRPAAQYRGRYDQVRAQALALLGGKLPSGGGEPSSRGSGSVPTGTRTVTDEAGFEDARRKYALGRMLAKSNPNNTLIRLGILPTEAPSPDAFQSTTPTFTDPIRPLRSPAAGDSTSGQGAGGAAAALGWAERKIGNQETGPNTGGLASFANRRFGMSGQPWCAMFTSLAVTKGGAPRQARTASVAAVLQKAQAGQGYVRGFIPVNRARPGDLITFGTRHIGMVESVSGNRVRMIAGNDSNRVQRRTVKVAGDTRIVRPAYRG